MEGGILSSSGACRFSLEIRVSGRVEGPERDDLQRSILEGGETAEACATPPARCEVARGVLSLASSAIASSSSLVDGREEADDADEDGWWTLIERGSDSASVRRSAWIACTASERNVPYTSVGCHRLLG